MNRREISEAEITAVLKRLPGWQIQKGKLNKTFKFPTFALAIGWMVSVAVAADKMDHHPEWSNVYNRVEVNLVTHDLGDVISTWDVELAEKMEELAKK